MMDVSPINDLITLLGVDLQTLATLSGIVFLGVEWIKRKFPVQGMGTEIVALVIAGGLAFNAVRPDLGGTWAQFVTLSLVTWLAPAGFHSARKNGKKQ